MRSGFESGQLHATKDEAFEKTSIEDAVGAYEAVKKGQGQGRKYVIYFS